MFPGLMRRFAALTMLAFAGLSGSASAEGPPIMPLSQVTRGMHCTATTVVQGTTLSTFDVDVLDVVSSGGSSHDGDLILFKASGRVVDPTGIAEGYSGSPIWCPDAAGVQRIIGAISYGSGEYGGLVALATPIEAVLGTPVDPPANVRVAPSVIRAARPLATPLTVTGLSTTVGNALAKAAKVANRPLHVAPARPRDVAPAPAPTLQPGSSIATMFSGGDVGMGAIGTVSYVDGDKVWAFGHPLEGVGQRSLLLSDAYVYTVINNPLGTEDATSFKLAAPGRELGTLTWDGNNAVAGRVGPLPVRIPLDVVARDEDRGTSISSHSTLVDERSLGMPGSTAISMVPPAAVADATYRVMSGAPSAQTGSMCLTITFAARPKPVKICNRYVGGGMAMQAMAGDVSTAVSDIVGFRFGAPAISSIRVEAKLKRGMRAGELRKVTAPQVLKRGRVARLTVRYQQLSDGKVVTRRVNVRVPATAQRGTRQLVLTGTDLDSYGGSDEGLDDLFAALFGGGSSTSHEPHTLTQLVNEIEQIKRTDGVSVRFRSPSSKSSSGSDGSASAQAEAEAQAQASGATAARGKIAPILAEPGLRISGKATTIVRVR